MTRLSFDLHLDKGGFSLAAAADIQAGGVIGLIGPSGAGKSSLLRCLAGLESGAGSIEFNGQDLAAVPVEQRGVGMVFQQPSLFPHLSVAGNLDYAWKRAAADSRLPVTETAERLRISHLLARDPHSLSGGEAQRVAIARALIAAPGLLLLDEPLAAVDVQGRREVMDCLEQLRAERPVPMLYVSHNLDEVARLADTLLLMEAGRIRAQGPVAELLTGLDLPLAQAPDAEAILEGHVMRVDESGQLTMVETAAGVFLLSGQPLPTGQSLRLRIAARDVSLALSRATDSSILNILSCQIAEIREAGAGQCLLRLDASGEALLARITLQSARNLGLKAGMDVYAQIKSVALA